MKVRFTEDFLLALNEQVDYIARDKPKAARKFKNDILKKIAKDIQNPFHFTKSRYYDNENIRDYIFKGMCLFTKLILKKILFLSSHLLNIKIQFK